jgi:succinyl-diaminopimelate desuccinylase
MIDAVKLSLELISKKSISGFKDEGAISLLVSNLKNLGFNCEVITFSDVKSYDVENLYAEIGTGGKNLCFAGHTDVVPPGDENLWSVKPFAPEIIDGYLVGRGASDMKCAIAAFVSAVSEYLETNKNFGGKLSLLITGDEEADSINGTVKLLEHIYKNGKKIDNCIVGEPTNPENIWEMIKIGRRGTINFTLTVKGVQGHVAYPNIADNPVTKLVNILHKLKQTPIDSGNDFFQSSNLEVTSIDVGNKATNVIPERAVANFNVRFNNLQTADSVKKFVEDICKSETKNYEIKAPYSFESFLCKPEKFANIIKDSVIKVTGKTPVFSTTGGTSDARFIKDYCEVAEFGLINKTAHKIDEKVKVEEIVTLKNIYLEVIKQYFA